MKRNLIIATVAVVAALGIYGYFNAVPGIDSEEGRAPQIGISPDSFDFGEVRYGQIVNHVFELKNSGDDNLKINKVATSCACTTASVNKDTLLPGEKTELSVVYNTGAMSGPHAMGDQERIIYVKSNDPVSPQTEVKIYAFVK